MATSYANLPFRVPETNFNYQNESDNQVFFRYFFDQYKTTEEPSKNTPLTPQQVQSHQRADRVIEMIERRKELNQLRRSSRNKQRNF